MWCFDLLRFLLLVCYLFFSCCLKCCLIVCLTFELTCWHVVLVILCVVLYVYLVLLLFWLLFACFELLLSGFVCGCLLGVYEYSLNWLRFVFVWFADVCVYLIIFLFDEIGFMFVALVLFDFVWLGCFTVFVVGLVCFNFISYTLISFAYVGLVFMDVVTFVLVL